MDSQALETFLAVHRRGGVSAAGYLGFLAGLSFYTN